MGDDIPSPETKPPDRHYKRIPILTWGHQYTRPSKPATIPSLTQRTAYGQPLPQWKKPARPLSLMMATLVISFSVGILCAGQMATYIDRHLIHN